ncbi:hypothetical protein B0T16DRAFT_360466, partial [Cercophora newfieldiana]
MDPLSIIGSVAGVATAGVSLVSVLFEAIDTYRNAPKEISTIARGIQELSFILDHLVEVLSDGREIYTKLLRNSVLTAVNQIDDVHEEVWDLIERGESGFGRVKWTFRKSKMRDLVVRIEAQKSTIQLVCTTLLLAMQQRRVAKSKEREVALFARRRLRRQAVNLVNAAHQSLLDLTQGSRHNDDDEDGLLAAGPQVSEQRRTGSTGNASSSFPVANPTIRVSDSDARGDNTQTGQELDVRRQRDPDTAALFLYNMVFSRTAEKDARQTKAAPDDTNALVIHNPRGRDVVLASRPFASHVVDNLLHDWTFLSDQEIEEAAEESPQNPSPQRQQKEPQRQPAPGESTSSQTSHPSRNQQDARRKSPEDPRKARPRGRSDTGPRPQDDYVSARRTTVVDLSSDSSDGPRSAKPTRTAGLTSGSGGRERPRSQEFQGGRTKRNDRGAAARDTGRSRDESRSREQSGSSKMQQAAMASLIAGATEAFRVSKEPGGWRGEKAKRILTAAAGAA